MVTRIKIKNIPNQSVFGDVFSEFEDIHGMDITSKILVRESDCLRYEYLYIFADTYQFNSLINLLEGNGVNILESVDFTDKLVNIIVTNKTNAFINQFPKMFDFDTIIEDFTITNIDKDDVLDKISKLGLENLTPCDYKILHS